MKDQLPRTIDPIRLAVKNKQLAGQITLGRLGRIKSILAANAAVIDDGCRESDSSSNESNDENNVADVSNADVIVDFQLDFGVDRLGIRNIRGRITAPLNLVCQRCLKRMSFNLDARVMLGLVLSQEQAEQLPAKYEPLLIEAEEVSFLDIIEDEMILAIPDTPMHDAATCDSGAVHEHYNANNAVEEQGSEDGNQLKRENPFAVLAKLKSKDKD